MEIVLKIDDKQILIKLQSNVIFFGKNTNYKNKLFSNLVDGLTGKKKNIMINDATYNYKDYNIITINEDNDFANEFKFTKSNALKQIIYNDVINKINEEKLINYTNEIFDTIDEKVNSLLDRKINKKSDNNISFRIEIPDINSIIDRFTNIYIDNILLNDSEISKSMKRKLLYQLYFLDIKNTEKNTIVIINNFDVYLNVNETINILNTINSLTNDNCHFILSSCNNVFEYLNYDLFNTYKITNNKIIPLNTIDIAIKNYIIKKEYNNNQSLDYDAFYDENEQLISNDEITDIKNKIISKYPHLVSKILNSDSIKVVLSKPKHITCEYIICENKNFQLLFSEISNFFVD